ncbi:MAG: YecR family lipoprotein [Amaricoccus sp.]
MRLVLITCVVLVAGCASSPPGIKPVAAGDSRKDGIVTMASTGTIYNPVSPDWRPAQAAAARKCGSWGYGRDSTFAGWQEACLAYDLYGRCVSTTVTRFYSCNAG